MCTVTYIPPSEQNSFILTSNRDEKDFRPTISPEVYLHEGISVGFPKDAKAGGSWIAVNEKGRLCCLLNGAYNAHKKQNFHTTSRGKVLLELAASQYKVEEFFNEKELESVEPFTIVTIDQNNSKIFSFSEFVWDGKEKHFRVLDKSSPHIWSSTTLYTDEDRKLRNVWFSDFFKKFKNNISPDQIYSFHSGSHTTDSSINVITSRKGGLKTVSITQVQPHNNKLFMKYADLLNKSNHELEI